MICGIVGFLTIVWGMILLATRFPERTIRDVYPFFHYVESEILIGAFHPDPEADYKAAHGSAEFKKWQIRRIHLALHLCRNISANCSLLITWAAFERKVNWENLPELLQKGLRGFQLSAQHARTAAFAIRFRLRWRLVRMTLLPFLPAPSFSTLVEHSNALIEFYGKAETLAEALSLGYGEDIHQNMVAVLGMVDLELNG
jgi:hypothetical protein